MTIPHYAIDFSHLVFVISGQDYKHRRVHLAYGPHCESCDIPTMEYQESHGFSGDYREWDEERTRVHRERHDKWWESGGLVFCSTCVLRATEPGGMENSAVEWRP